MDKLHASSLSDLVRIVLVADDGLGQAIAKPVFFRDRPERSALTPASTSFLVDL